MGQVSNFASPYELHHDYIKWSQESYKSNGVVISNMFLEPVFLISNPEIIKNITVTNGPLFPKSQLAYTALERILGPGLIVSSGALWKRQRNLIGPIFSQKNIDTMVKTMIERTDLFVEKWNKERNVKICTEMSKLTLDIISTCAFGDECPVDEISTCWRCINEGIMTYFLFASFLPISVVDNLPFCFTSVKKNFITLKNYIKSMIVKKKKSESLQKDLLSLLIASDEENPISEDLLLAESLVFLLAGHETTSGLLSNAIYYLCKFPEYQSIILKEIEKVSKDQKELNPETVSEFVFVRQILNECLRLHPPVYEIDKENSEEMEVCGLFIPEGTMLGINIYGTHTNPSIWNDPYKFDPHRWSEENINNIKDLRSSFIPFSLGGRDCVGKFFSYSEATIILTRIVSKYLLEFVDPRQELIPELYITTKPKNYSIKVSKR